MKAFYSASRAADAMGLFLIQLIPTALVPLRRQRIITDRTGPGGTRFSNYRTQGRGTCSTAEELHLGVRVGIWRNVLLTLELR